jgi:hypothetical protein
VSLLHRHRLLSCRSSTVTQPKVQMMFSLWATLICSTEQAVTDASTTGVRAPCATTTANEVPPFRKRKSAPGDILNNEKRITRARPAPSTAVGIRSDSTNQELHDLKLNNFIDPSLPNEEGSGAALLTGLLPMIQDDLPMQQDHSRCQDATAFTVPHPFHPHGSGSSIGDSWSADDWIKGEMDRLGLKAQDLDDMRAYAAANEGRLMPLPGQQHIRQYAHLVLRTGAPLDSLWPDFEIRVHHDEGGNDDAASVWHWYT